MQSVTTEEEREWVRHAASLDAQIVMNKTQRTARPRDKTLLGPPNVLRNCEHGKRLLCHTRLLIKRRRLATHHLFKPPCRTRRIIICDVATVQTRIQTSCAPARPHVEITRHAFRTPCCHTCDGAAANFCAGVKPPDEIGEQPGQTQILLKNHGNTMPLNNCTEKLLRWRACVALVQPTFDKQLFRKLANIKHTTVLTFKTPEHCLHLFLAIANIEQTCRLCWQTVQNPFSDLDQKNVHNDANSMNLHAPTVRIQKQPPKQTMARKRNTSNANN